MKLIHSETTYTKRTSVGSTGSLFIAVLLCCCGFLQAIARKCALLHENIRFLQLRHDPAYFCAFVRKAVGLCAERVPNPSDRSDLGVERGVAG